MAKRLFSGRSKLMTNVPRERRPRRPLLFVAAVLAAALGFGIGVAAAADPRLDEADAALQKAQALLEASQSGGVSEQTQHRFEKAVARAIADVEDAREQIAEAKAAVDNSSEGAP
jgi:hypothetical protein